MTQEQAVVVGAAGALAGAAAKRFAAAGLEVVAVGRDADKLAGLGEGFIACPCDIGEDASTEAIKAAITGPVRMVFMGAGLPVRGSVDTIEPSAVATAMNVKVGGMVRLVHATRDALVEGGRIAALSGYLGAEPNPDELGPGIVNAALQNLMRQLAGRYGARGVTVTTITPGPVDTQRLRNIAAARAQESGKSVDEHLNEYRAESSLGKLLTVDDVAWAAELLLSPHADALHGSTLHLDGGRRRSIF